MKVIIEDLRRHLKGEIKEDELPADTCIRFENGNRKIRIGFNSNGEIEIIECGDTRHALIINPASSNKVIVS